MKYYIFSLILTQCINVSIHAQKPLIIAHRGASSLAPENTLAAFSKAVEVGADYFELDVKASSDDSLMVFHDKNLDRTTNGSGNFNDFTYSQLRELDAGSWFSDSFAGEKIPTLRESLQLAIDQDIKVCVEIKDYDYTSQVMDLIDEMQVQDKVIIFCFDFDAVAKAKEMAPGIPVCYLKTVFTNGGIDRIADINGEVAGAGTGKSKNLIDYAHSQGIEFWRWTVNDTDKMKELIEIGIDGIITNYPQELVGLLNR